MNDQEQSDLARTPYQIATDYFDGMWPIWRERFDSSDKLNAFLSGQRYANQYDRYQLDRRGIQITGQETQDQIDHVIARTTERQRSAEGKPNDHVNDPDAAEGMVALINNFLDDPRKMFGLKRYMALKAARVERRGVLWLSKVDNWGPFGSCLTIDYQPNGSCMWDPAYHPHDEFCQVLIRYRRVDYRVANRDYKVDWLRPDHESLVKGTSNWRAGIPLLNGFADKIATECLNDRRVTICETWIKNDPTVDTSKPPKTTTKKLKPADRYMRCNTPTTEGDPGCGYRSQTQGQMKAQGLLKGMLPESVPAATSVQDMGGCPRCGGTLDRIDAVDMNQEELMYAKGRRLIVTAPFCPGPDGNEHLYDGSWPFYCRSFPMLVHFASVKPGDNTGGPGDVDRMFDQQMASDQMMTMMVQRIFENRDITVIPSVGYLNARNERWEGRDDDENFVFKDMRKANGPGWEIQRLNTTSLDPAWAQGYQAVQNALRSFVNKADLAPTVDATRDVPVGTAQQMVQESEVATEDFIRRCNDDLGQWYGVVEDGLRATVTPEQLQRLNLDGTEHLIELWGDTLPSMDYTITEQKKFTGLDEAKAKAIPALMGAVQQASALGLDPIAFIELYGDTNDLPRSSVRKFTKLVQEAQAKQDAAAAQAAAVGGGAPGGPGIGPQGMGPGAVSNGPMTAGMAPAVAA